MVPTEEGPDALGYVYFFSWEGQAFNLSETRSFAPDVRLELRSRERLEDGDSALASGSIAFEAAELEPGGASASAAAGSSTS